MSKLHLVFGGRVSDPQGLDFVDLSNLYIQPALDLVWNGESSAADALGGIKDKVNAELAK